MDELTMFRRPIIDLPEEWLPPIGDLPGDLRRIAEVLEAHIPDRGVRLTLLIAQAFQGQHVYFRNPQRFLIAYRDSCMRSAYDQGGVTAKELATRAGLSTRQVECILARPDNQEELKERQMSLFG